MALQLVARRFWTCLIAAAMLLPAARVLAADGSASGTSSSSADSGSGADFFAAMQNGDLDVQIIPRDSRRAQVIVKNNTDQPLTVKLPDAFVAMPVLAQANGIGGGGANGNRSTSTSSNNNKNQSVGGGMTGGTTGGMFSIPPERVVKMQVPVVCLEYGKAEPNAHVPYTMVSADKYTKDPEVQDVCRQLGQGKLDQRAAQAAAWHLANHMSWADLADLKVFPHFPQYRHPYFSDSEIHQAMVIVDRAIKYADAKKAGRSTASSAADSTDSASSASTSTSTSTAAKD